MVAVCFLITHKKTIQMSHWLHTMVDGAKFWIDCQQLATIGTLSRWQLIQNLTPSTNLWRQCDIPIVAGQLNVPRNIRICQLFVYLIKTKIKESNQFWLFAAFFTIVWLTKKIFFVNISAMAKMNEFVYWKKAKKIQLFVYTKTKHVISWLFTNQQLPAHAFLKNQNLTVFVRLAIKSCIHF